MEPTTMPAPTRQARNGPKTILERPVRIVMADDDQNDHLLLLMAADAANIQAEFDLVQDGAELMMRLEQAESADELPDLIVLDLRMPGVDGHRTLDLLQRHPVLWQIPVVVFTSSTRRTDEILSYERGARWVEVKPSDFDGMISFARSLAERANHGAYDIDDAEALGTSSGHSGSLWTERIAELSLDVDDELMFRFPEL